MSIFTTLHAGFRSDGDRCIAAGSRKIAGSLEKAVSRRKMTSFWNSIVD